jgi:hypothetical protein
VSDERTPAQIDEDWDAFWDRCPRGQWSLFLHLEGEHSAWVRAETAKARPPYDWQTGGL